MTYKFMKFEVRDNVAWITFNRPEAFNAINFQATNEFNDIVIYWREMTTLLHAGISRLAWLRAPIIAAVNGVAAGAG